MFSVVIPTYRRRRSLERVLDGLRLQDYPHGQLEVVVVDDGGQDGTPEMLRHTTLPFSLTVLEQANLGPAAARNLGVKHARGTFLLFLDDDVIPTPRLVARHAAAHGDRTDRVVIGTMLGLGRERWPWLRWESARLAEQYAAMGEGVFTPTPWQFYTGNASVRREHVVAAGGFDVRFRRAEDIELGFRLKRLGLEFVFQPEAEGLHLMQRSWAAWLDAARQYGRNDVTFGKVDERVVEETIQRHPYTLRLIRWGLPHARLRSFIQPLAQAVASVTYRLGAMGAAMAVCGAIFNLHYWVGVEEKLGSAAARRLLQVVLERAQSPGQAGRGSPPAGLIPMGLEDRRR